MVYSNKFVMCVLLNGRPQKELANGVVSLPFGTEYALRFRNKNNRRAVVQIYIDGENVSGGGYVVNAHSYVDIKRHHDIDRAFKFVSLDSEDAVDYGKDGPNEDKVKGTIEARFYLEKERPQVIYRDVHHDHHHHHHHDHYHPRPRPRPWPYYPYDDGIKWTCGGGGTTSSLGPTVQGGLDSDVSYGMNAGNETLNFSDSPPSCSTKGMSSAGGQSSMRRSKTANYGDDIATFKRISIPEKKLQDGCTVEGYSTGQNFHSVHVDLEETYTSLKIFLQGFDDLEDVEQFEDEPKPRKARKTNKEVRIDDLEAENEELRRQLAELENEKLKAELANKKKRRRKKKTEVDEE